MDSQGLLLKVHVHAASVSDRQGLPTVLPLSFCQRHPTLNTIYADMGYTGPKLAERMRRFGIELTIVKRPHKKPKEYYDLFGDLMPPIPSKFTLLPKRWVVERTFAWLGRYRRLSKDYEFYPRSSESFIYLAMSRLMLRRLTL